MSSSTTQKETAVNAQQINPYAPSKGILDKLLGQTGNVDTSLTQGQTRGINSLTDAANNAGGFTPDLQKLTQTLFAGGNYGQGDPGIQKAQGTATNTLGGIASGSLDPMQNPGTAPLIQSIIDQVNHSVGDQFAAAGRGGIADSGYGTRAYTTGLSQGLAQPLLNQYNQNVANATGAANSLVNNAIGASNAYNQTAAGQLGAQLQAPQSLANFGIPGAMQLGAGGLNEQTQLGNLGGLASLLLPIASSFPESTGTSTGTQTQKGNPWQTLTGGLLGLGGLASYGMGNGWLSGLFKHPTGMTDSGNG